MGLKILVFILLLSWVYHGYSQDKPYVDSLENMLDVAENDSVKALALRRLTWHFIKYDTHQAMEYASQLKSIAEQKKDPFYQALSAYYIGLIHRLQGEFLEALNEFEQAANFYQTDPIYAYSLNSTYFQIATAYQSMNIPDSAIVFYIKELEYWQAQKDYKSVANSLNGIGVTYRNMGMLEEALEYFNQSIHISKEHDLSDELSNALVNKANALVNLGEVDLAIKLAEESLHIDESQEYRRGMAFSYETLSNCYQEKEKPDEALLYANKAYQLFVELDEKERIASSAVNLASIYEKNQEWENARNWAETGLEVAEVLDLKRFEQHALDILSKVAYAQKKYFEAYNYLHAKEKVVDSLFQIERIAIANEIEAKYQLEEKQKEISFLRIENELQEIKLEKDRNRKRALSIGIGLLAVLSILITRILQLRITAQKLRNQKMQVQQEKTIEEIERKNTIQKMDALIEGQEEERSRIASDLHDGLGGLMATIRSRYENIGSEMDALSILPSYKNTGKLINEACSEIRRISHNMMPTSLHLLGLNSAVEDLATRLQSQKLDCEVEMVGKPIRLGEHKEIMIYRVVQELVQNILKHAQADHVLIQINYQKEFLNLLIEDNGVGFDPQKASLGLGLKSVHSRVDYLNATMDIYSKPLEGTSIQIEIPI